MADMLASVADLASFLQRDVDTASATLALEAATAVVQTAAGQRIVRVTDDEVVLDVDQHDRSLYLDLPELPVISVASVEVGGTAVTDYTVQLSRGRLWRSMGWRSATLPQWNAPSTVTTVYTHGLLSTDQEIQLARASALSLAAGVFVNPTGAVSERIDDYAVAFDKASSALAAAPSLAQQLRRQYGRRGRSVKLVTVGDH